jgi:hypothetical protein
MPITDNFQSFPLTLGDPVADAQEITPSDSAELTHVTRALYVGVAGDVRVTLAGGTLVTFGAMTSGWHPIRVAQVHATGTTATHLVGCW